MASASDSIASLTQRLKTLLERLEALPVLTPPQRKALGAALGAAEAALDRSTPKDDAANALRGIPPAQPGAKGLHIWCDGSCSPNPGPGGWGTLIERDGQREELSGAAPKSTNNIMEMTAAIEGLKAMPPGSVVTVTTDSQYVVKGVTEWVKGWKRRGWRKADGEPVLNQALWKELDALNAERTVRWEWVRGHSGHPENEHCDELANAARRSLG